ncbi:MAG: T9SS type A sorting domain-containing protein [Hymenobacter sp.]|nr:T9SS type A sorting domain-containing protein [Hymenobacter sp.]
MNTPHGDASFDAPTPELATSGDAIFPDIFPYPPAVEAQASSPFRLDQNYPNPFEGETTVPFVLNTAADVRLDLLDLSGRKVAGVVRKDRAAGAQSIKLNLRGLGLPAGDYLYQLQVTCQHGVFQQRLRMTAE